MAITTVDGIVAGFRPPEEFLKVGGTMEAAGVMHSLFYTSGRPGAATAPSPGLNGAHLTSYAGQIPFSNPVSAAYLAMLEATATTNGTLLVCDRLWHNSGYTATTTAAENTTFGTLEARDANAATLGDGVMLGIEVSTATTNAGAITNMTASYTNSAGTAGQTATIASFPITAAAGTFIPFRLAAGDRGVRSVQSLTKGTSLVTGTVHLVCYRVLARIGLLANVLQTKDWQQLGLPQLFANTVPFLLWVPSATTATTITGGLVYSHG